MANNDLEGIVNRASKSGSLLEKITGPVSAAYSVAKSIASYGLNSTAALSAGLFSYVAVGPAAPLMGATFALGKALLRTFSKKKPHNPFIKDMLKEFSVGSLLGIVGVAGYDIIGAAIPNYDLAGKLTRTGLVLGALNPLFVGTHLFTDYLFQKSINPFKAASYAAHNFTKAVKQTTMWLGLPLGLTVNGFGGGIYGMMPVNTAYRMIMGENDYSIEARGQTQHSQPMPQLPQQLRNAA